MVYVMISNLSNLYNALATWIMHVPLHCCRKKWTLLGARIITPVMAHSSRTLL
jgi:hypothetical protein